MQDEYGPLDRGGEDVLVAAGERGQGVQGGETHPCRGGHRRRRGTGHIACSDAAFSGAVSTADSIDIMATTLLRDIPDDVLERYARMAEREGVSRNALLVRVLVDSSRRRERTPLTVEDLRASSDRTADLLDPSVMADAWS